MRYLGIFVIAYSYGISCATLWPKLNRFVKGEEHFLALTTPNSHSSATHEYRAIKT